MFCPSGDRESSGDLSSDGATLQEPKLTTLISMDQVSVVSTLTWLIEGAEGAEKITEKRARWIFALSAALEKPIHAETAALFRSLFRLCCSLRADLSGPSDSSLPLLNMLIVISGGHFGQDESIK